MDNAELAGRIRDKALELGYDDCGIIRLSEMDGYADRVRERVGRFPRLAKWFARYEKFSQLEREHPWAKSVVVATSWYGKYGVPEAFRDRIGKAYLADCRKDANTVEYQNSRLFEEWMNGAGLRTRAEREYGITSLRWAGQQAGLGILRKNNFFYSKRGSWNKLETWLIDRDLELKRTPDIPKCPESCTRCADACPTGAITGPYEMDAQGCISYLTTLRGASAGAPLLDKTRGWFYGCDACQDACPFNRNAWKEEVDFPGAAALAEQLGLEQILAMDYDTVRSVLVPKFWYIGPDDAWKFKTNVLNAMRNDYRDDYREAILAARSDPEEKVRAMAEDVAKAVL